MGPKGRNVVLGQSFGSPTITNDGVSIAKEIELEEATENIGAQIIKEVAEKTNDGAGDGTTASVVLSFAVVSVLSSSMSCICVSSATSIDASADISASCCSSLSCKREIVPSILSRRVSMEKRRLAISSNDGVSSVELSCGVSLEDTSSLAGTTISSSSGIFMSHYRR